MVLKIKLSNFFSFKEDVILDLRAGHINTKKSKNLTDNLFKFNQQEVLKTIALYGANASGKSNLFKTISFCNAMVYESHKHNESSIFNFNAFRFEGYENKPSTYFIRFVIKDIEYEYSFTITRNEILRESLFYYPNGRKAKVFERNEDAGKSKRDKYSFGSSVIKRPFDVAENTSNKTLYISRASQLDREIPKAIFNFFHTQFILNHSSFVASNFESLIHTYKAQLLKALRLADSDIIDFKCNFKNLNTNRLKSHLDTEVTYFENGILENIDIKTYHKFSPKTAIDFMTEESSGTKKLFFMMLAILDATKNDKTLLIDEIEDSLHPKIVDLVVNIFNSSSKSQLIFSTHQTNLLDLDKLRKDQIWFFNKKDHGESELYSLYEYTDFRENMDLEKAYLQGRFDAVPNVDDSKDNLLEIMAEKI